MFHYLLTVAPCIHPNRDAWRLRITAQPCEPKTSEPVPGIHATIAVTPRDDARQYWDEVIPLLDAALGHRPGETVYHSPTYVQRALMYAGAEWICVDTAIGNAVVESTEVT